MSERVMSVRSRHTYLSHDRQCGKGSSSHRPPSLRRSWYLAVLFASTLLCSGASAQPYLSRVPIVDLPHSISDPRIGSEDTFRSALKELAKTGTILVDQGPLALPPSALLPVVGDWYLESADHAAFRYGRRADPSVTPSSISSTVSVPTTTSPSVVSTATLATSPLPSPFDSSLGNNFSAPSCPQFLNGFLQSSQFKACLPFSLLLESSQSFFQAEKSLVRITQTLDATCAANVTTCTSYLSTLANNLTSFNNCGADYAAQNPTVLQALTGLHAYKPLYQASCLRNPISASYCFADAITNVTSPTDSYIYYLPLNISLPGGSQPTCDACLQNTMAVFNAASANRSQPVASVYSAAAVQVNSLCGPGFVNSTIPSPLSNSARSVRHSWFGMWTLICVLSLSWLL